MRSSLIAAAATLLAGGIAAGAVGPDEPRARLAVDSAAPLFAAHDLLPGDTRSACLSVANTGDGSGRVALYAPGLSGDLLDHLSLVVTRGCSAGATVYRGRLADFPSQLRDALLDPAAWQPGERHAYRFTIALGDDPAAEGLTARWNWRLAVESAARSRAASSCARLQVAGVGEGRGRVLTRTVRVGKRVRAVLVVRTAGSAAAPRVAVTTGLRVRGDKTLLTKGWARVRYRLNGSAPLVARQRPFRTQLSAASLRPGRNRISVAVQRRGRASKSLAAFSLSVTPTTIAGRPVCVVSA